jgi:protein SERAC1
VDASTTIFWPAEVLAKECSDIRVLSWGYDTVVTKGYKAATKNSIFAHARNLLAALEREQVANRPLVFVAHSLGGIIVKEVSSTLHRPDGILIFGGPPPI